MLLDKTDKKILSLLQQNSNLSNQELADLVALSPSPCLRRVKLLQQEGYIDKYVAILNPEKFDLKLSALVSVSLTNHEPELMRIFQKKIVSYSEVIACYLVAGQAYDYIIKVLVSDLDAYHNFLLQELTQIKGVKNVNTSFVLKTITDRTQIPI